MEIWKRYLFSWFCLTVKDFKKSRLACFTCETNLDAITFISLLDMYLYVLQRGHHRGVSQWTSPVSNASWGSHRSHIHSKFLHRAQHCSYFSSPTGDLVIFLFEKCDPSPRNETEVANLRIWVMHTLEKNRIPFFTVNIPRISSYTWLFAKNTSWFVVLRSNP